MDCIRIKDLEIFGYHGLLPEERTLGQKFLVSADLYFDSSMAGQTDDLQYSVNYADATRHIKNFLEKNTYKLLEAAAEQTARSILQNYPLVDHIRVEIKKPWAPILLPIDTVSVRIERSWHRVYVGLGSNMGDKKENLERALEKIKADETCRLISQSGFIATKPVGFLDQDDFLNAAAEVRTLKSPGEFLSLIQDIETDLGRVRTIHWGPRTIDVDILFYDSLVMNTETLTIPHPEMQSRLFVLEPLAQIAPDTVHPVLKQTVRELYEIAQKPPAVSG
ncbi:7,8-dihydroneopterin aldolase [Spirochaetia bacterium]|nr:7,8-dihydroneopterin aldolase [Spirochaetia bacterium]